MTSARPPSLPPLDDLSPDRPPRRRPPSGYVGTTILLTLLLIPAHLLWYTRIIAWQLWEHLGGISHQGNVTAFGGTPLAPTVPLHLPAGLIFYATLKYDGLSARPLGSLLILAGSIAAGTCAASLTAATLWRERPLTGPYHWRLWGVLLGWGWVLVPAEMSWIYQWTVVY